MASTSAAPPGADAALKRWEVENAVSSSTEADAYYKYDPQEQANIQREKPWKKDPHYFKSVRISALALLKMAMHAKSGGNLEVMGMMQGKVQGDAFIVLDAFALPVEGTETRVNAQEEAYEFMVAYNHASKQIQRHENVVGWYHSHPGYGCWLSGIDCSTQMAQQQYQDPFLAVVVDPHRTIAAGKVEIGAFRTYPEGYKPPDAKLSEYQTIPLEKIEDFGVHCKQYYSLDVSFFKSSTDAYLLDLLWNKYWANMLSASPLLAMYDLTNGQIADIGNKLEQALASTTGSMGMSRFLGAADAKQKEDRALTKVCQDVKHLAVEQVKGLSSQVVKDLLFNDRLTASAAEPMTS